MTQCKFDFFNDTGNIVTSFTFQTMVNPNLSTTAAGSFTCDNGGVNGGFFLNCAARYNPAGFPAGTLIFSFSGVDPSDGDESGGDTEIGEHEGIPLGQPEGTVGHFAITLNGWEPNAVSNGETLYNGLPTLDNTFTEAAAPEPSSALILGGGLLLFVMLRRRTVR